MKIYLLALALLTSGCVSIFPSEYRQSVLVTDRAPGSEVYQDDKLIGHTPDVMRIRRGRQPEIEIRRKDGSRETIPLTTQYRWRDSFRHNFVWYIYAPIGWLADLVTGNAWDMDAPTFYSSPRPKYMPLAVAPPEGADQDTVDLLGRRLVEKLSTDKRFIALNYDSTLPEFDLRGYDSQPTVQGDRDTLLYETHAKGILWSKVREENGRLLVESHVDDIYSKESAAEPRFEFREIGSEDRTTSYWRKYVHLLPNTAFINFTNYSASISVDHHSQQGKGVSDGTTLGKFVDTIGALSLNHLERPRRDIYGRWKVDFVPTFVFSFKRIRFQFYNPPEEQDFDRTYLTAGYGLEAGYLWKFGYPYFDFIPAFSWTWLKYGANGQDYSRNHMNLTVIAEVGYSYFFTDHFVGKLYTRTVSEDTKLWQQAIRDVRAENVEVSSAGSNFSGIAFGYYFTPPAKKIKIR